VDLKGGDPVESAIGQVVTFYLGKELFGIELEYVKEVIRLPEMVRVPGTPAYFSGLANLRGSLLPVISGRGRLGLAEAAGTDATRVVVIEYRGETLGYTVDRMSEVIRLENTTEESLRAAQGREKFVSRVIKANESSVMVMVVNIEVLFPRSEGFGHRSATAWQDGQKETETARQEELQQFVGFKLADEEYAIGIESVQEIVRVPDRISRSPGSPPYMDGLFSLRRRTVPMLNLRQFLGLPERTYDDRSRVLVLNSGGNGRKRVVGIGVDAVTEVLRFTAEEIEPLPELLTGEEMKDFDGVCKLGGGQRLVYLLNPNRILAGGDLDPEAGDGETSPAQSERRDLSEEQFVIFHLHGEEYAVAIGAVREIIRLPEIVRVPRAPDYVEGVINIRGTVVPVINLRLKLGLPAREGDDRSRIVVVDMNGVPTGLVVDDVREVRKISTALTAPVPPVLGAHLDTGYLQGVVRQSGGQKSVLLLNLQNVLTGEEKAEVAQVTAELSEGAGEDDHKDTGADR